MCVENIDESTCTDVECHAASSLANEPISMSDVNWKSVEGVWMCESCHDTEFRKNGQTRPKSTACRRRLRGRGSDPERAGWVFCLVRRTCRRTCCMAIWMRNDL